MDEDQSFRAHLARVVGVCEDAYRHADYPFDKMVADLGVERDPARHPVFQVLVSAQDGRAASTPFASAAMTPVEIDWERVRYDAAVTLSGSGSGMELVFEYRSDLVDGRIAEWMVDRLLRLLAGVVDNPGRRIADLCLVGGEELDQLSAWEHHEGPDAVSLLPDLVAGRVAEAPDRTAVEINGACLSFRQLDERAASVAAALRAAGVAYGDVVAITVGHTLLWPAAVLAAWRLGAAFVAVDPAYPLARQQFMIKDSGSRAVVSLRGIPIAP